MRMARLTTVLLLPVLLLPALAQAKPEIALSMLAEKEITIIEEGVEVTKRVEAETIEPGEVIHYTLTYSNSGDEAATDVVVSNPIPSDTVYILESARGDNADITFSIDGGNTYKKPNVLTYKVKVNGKWEERSATAERYTHIRWIIDRIDNGSSGNVFYSVRIK